MNIAIFLLLGPSEGMRIISCHGSEPPKQYEHRRIFSQTDSDIICCMDILIVDDELSIRELMADLLADEGYTVQTAIDGVDALAQLRGASQLPMLIMLDLMMPRMNGWEFRAALQQDPILSSIPVIVLSAHPDITNMSRALAAEAFLPKPIHIEHLLAVVEKFHHDK